MQHTVAFCCKECNCDITDFLRAVREEDLSFKSGVAAVPAGAFVELKAPWSYAEFVTGRDPMQSYRSKDGEVVALEPGDMLLNPADARFQVLPGASYGCCGLQPRAEANVACLNGHPIGTLHNDCWAAHVFRLQASRVFSVAP